MAPPNYSAARSSWMRQSLQFCRLTLALFKGCSKHEESFTELRLGALLQIADTMHAARRGDVALNRRGRSL